jgi:hypothetical protein
VIPVDQAQLESFRRQARMLEVSWGDRMRAGNEKPPRHWIWDDHPYLVAVAFLIACVVIGLELFFYMAGD